MIGKKLSSAERQALVDAPVYVTLLAAVKDGKVEETEKEMAERIARNRSAHGEPMLRDYWKEVQEQFSERLRVISNTLPEETDDQTQYLAGKLKTIKSLIDNLDDEEKVAVKKSLRSLAGKVQRADRNMFQYFMIPFGISENDDEMNNDQSSDSRHYAP